MTRAIILQSIYFFIWKKISSVRIYIVIRFDQIAIIHTRWIVALHSQYSAIRYDSCKKKREAIFAAGSSVNSFSSMTFSFMENSVVGWSRNCWLIQATDVFKDVEWQVSYAMSLTPANSIALSIHLSRLIFHKFTAL